MMRRALVIMALVLLALGIVFGSDELLRIICGASAIACLVMVLMISLTTCIGRGSAL